MVLRDELQRSLLTGNFDVAQARRKKEQREQKALGFGSSAERGLALRRPRSGEEVPKPEVKAEQRRRRSSSCSGDGRCVTPMAAEHSEASEKIKARIQCCLASRAGNGRSKHWKGEGSEKTAAAPKEVVTEKPRGRNSQRSESRSPKIAEMPKEGWGTSSRSTSAGVSPQREQGPPPAALGPPVPRNQRLLGRTPSPARPVPEGPEKPEPRAGGDNDLLGVYRNIFEEIISLDHQYGATLRKVKSIYDSHLDGLEELRRENERLRAALEPGVGAFNPLRRASAPAVAMVPVPGPTLPGLSAGTVVGSTAAGALAHFPLNGAGRPQSVPRLNLQGIYPAN